MAKYNDEENSNYKSVTHRDLSCNRNYAEEWLRKHAYDGDNDFTIQPYISDQGELIGVMFWFRKDGVPYAACASCLQDYQGFVRELSIRLDQIRMLKACKHETM